MTAIVDTSFLYALTDRSDLNHQRVRDFTEEIDEQLILPVVVIPEICYLILSRLGHEAMRQFLSRLTQADIEIANITTKDFLRINEILEQYADNHLDFADAAIVTIAERLNLVRIYTLDRRDFSIIRPRHCSYFELLP